MTNPLHKASVANKSPRKRKNVVAPDIVPMPVSTGTGTPPHKQRTIHKPKCRRVPSMTDIIFPQAAFERVVKEILVKLSPTMRIKKQATHILQEEAEKLLHQLFVNTQLVSDNNGTRLITCQHMNTEEVA
jgi:histone H3/H4